MRAVSYSSFIIVLGGTLTGACGGDFDRSKEKIHQVPSDSDGTTAGDNETIGGTLPVPHDITVTSTSTPSSPLVSWRE